MGVIVNLLYRGEVLTDNPHRNLFLDMEENIHIHYRDLRIELSRDEFEEITKTFALQSKELMQIIHQKNYQDGKLPNSNQEDTRIWTESRLNHPVKYNPRRISIEACTDGYHIHYRNYKFLLNKDDFRIFCEAISAIDIDKPYAATKKEVIQLLADNDIDFVVTENNEDESTSHLVVAKYHDSKIRTVCEKIGLSRARHKIGTNTYQGKDFSLVVSTSTKEEVVRLKKMQSAGSFTPLVAYLINEKPFSPDWLNDIKCQVLDLFSYAKQQETMPDVDLDFMSWGYDGIDKKIIFPFKPMAGITAKTETEQKHKKWSDFLKKQDLFFVKPSKITFDGAMQDQMYNKVVATLTDEIALAKAVDKIYLMGSTARRSMGIYVAPFVHSQWAKLGSDVDILIEINDDNADEIPESWHYINASTKNSCDIFHLSQLQLEDRFGFQTKYPNIDFFHHLIDAYVYFPAKSDKAKKDAFLEKFRGKLIFSRETSNAQPVKANATIATAPKKKRQNKEDESIASIQQKIKEEYGFAAKDIAKLDVSTENDLYCFTHHQQKLILKCYKVTGNYSSSRLRDHAHYEAAFVHAIANTQVQAHTLLKTTDQRWVTEVNQHPAILYTYAEGRIYKYPDPEYPIVTSVKALAGLHAEQINNELDIAKTFSFDDVFALWHPEYYRYASEVKEDAELNKAFSRLKVIYKDLETVHRRFFASKGIPWVHNHGDVNPRNFVINNGNACLIDFQNAYYGPRLLDIIDGAHEFSFGGKYPKKNNFNRFDTFISSYRMASPFTKVEQSCLDDAIQLVGVIKFIKEVRMIKGKINKGNLRRMRALSVAKNLMQRFL